MMSYPLRTAEAEVRTTGPLRMLVFVSNVNLIKSDKLGFVGLFCVPMMCSNPVAASKATTGSKSLLGCGGEPNVGKVYVATGALFGGVAPNEAPGPGAGGTGSDFRMTKLLSCRTFETMYKV